MHSKTNFMSRFFLLSIQQQSVSIKVIQFWAIQHVYLASRWIYLSFGAKWMKKNLLSIGSDFFSGLSVPWYQTVFVPLIGYTPRQRSTEEENYYSKFKRWQTSITLKSNKMNIFSLPNIISETQLIDWSHNHKKRKWNDKTVIKITHQQI